MVAGSMYWKSDRQKRKEFDAVVAEKNAKEKNDAWIRELEARDDEEKEIKQARDAKRKAFQEGKAASMIDDRERRMGTLEMVAELIQRKR